GDGTAACLLTATPIGATSHPIGQVLLGTDGSAGALLQGKVTKSGHVEVTMDGPALAGRAVRTMAHAVTEMTNRNGMKLADLAAVVAHGGNGRMPALLARTLGLAPETVWSLTATTGNPG